MWRGAVIRVANLLSGCDLAQWQAIALNTKPKRRPAEYMDLRFVNEAIAELGQK